MAELARRVDVPLMADECVATDHDLLQVIKKRAATVGALRWTRTRLAACARIGKRSTVMVPLVWTIAALLEYRVSEPR